MSDSGIGLLNGLAARMKYLNARQQIVAQNIANADTPGYRGRDLRAPDFATILGEAADGGARRPTVSITPRMAALGSRAGIGRGVEMTGSEEKPNGNNVTLEDELLKLSDIRTDYSAATNLYRKSIGLLKVALGKGA